MLSVIWNTILVNPIFNILVGLYHITGNLGISIILLTVFVRSLLIPVVVPSLRSLRKQHDLQPELDKIRKKFKHDSRKQAEMQMELFRKHGLNPASGCITQIVMIVVLFALLGVIRKFSADISISELNSHIYLGALKFGADAFINSKFLYLDLTKSDPYYIFVLLSGFLQFVSSKMMFPYAAAGEKAAEKTPDKSDDMAYNVQSQMLYMMPIMNIVIGIKLPSGVVLYLVTTTIFSIIQTYFVSGLGGVKEWIDKLKKLYAK